MDKNIFACSGTHQPPVASTINTMVVYLQCLFYLDCDIIGVAEIKLKGDEDIELPGYKFVSHNRQDLHIRARSGSGAVGCVC